MNTNNTNNNTNPSTLALEIVMGTVKQINEMPSVNYFFVFILQCYVSKKRTDNFITMPKCLQIINISEFKIVWQGIFWLITNYLLVFVFYVVVSCFMSTDIQFVFL